MNPDPHDRQSRWPTSVLFLVSSCSATYSLFIPHLVQLCTLVFRLVPKRSVVMKNCQGIASEERCPLVGQATYSQQPASISRHFNNCQCRDYDKFAYRCNEGNLENYQRISGLGYSNTKCTHTLTRSLYKHKLASPLLNCCQLKLARVRYFDICDSLADIALLYCKIDWRETEVWEMNIAMINHSRNPVAR